MRQRADVHKEVGVPTLGREHRPWRAGLPPSSLVLGLGRGFKDPCTVVTAPAPSLRAPAGHPTLSILCSERKLRGTSLGAPRAEQVWGWDALSPGSGVAGVVAASSAPAAPSHGCAAISHREVSIPSDSAAVRLWAGSGGRVGHALPSQRWPRPLSPGVTRVVKALA